MFLNGFFEHAQHVRLDRTVRVEPVAFLVNYRSDKAEFASEDRMVADEVPCPDMITMLAFCGSSRDALTAFARLGRKHSLRPHGTHAAPVSCPRPSLARPARVISR